MTDLPMLQALKQKMRFHEQRQKILAENVANASTPGYVGRDIKAPDFFRMAASVEQGAHGSVSMISTSPMHLSGHVISTADPVKAKKSTGYEVQPDGNAVSLEEQMMKVTDNQMDFQMATTLYQRSLGLIKTAIGKK